MRSYRKVCVFVLTVTLAMAGLSACSKDSGPEAALKTFLAGWAGGDVGASQLIMSNGEKVQTATVNEELKALTGTLYDAKPVLTVKKVTENGNLANGDVTVVQPLPSGLSWQYDTAVRLSKAKDGWQIIWEPTVVHPKLTKGDKLDTRRINQARGSVLGTGGEEIMAMRPVVQVYIWPAKADPGPKDKLVADLTAALKPVYTVNDGPQLITRANDPKNADQRIDVVLLRQERFVAIRPQLEKLKGVFFQADQRMLAESATFASGVLGRVAPVTEEIMKANPGVYTASDQVGQGGLQQKYDNHLRGQPGVRVVIARKAPDGTTQDTVLHTIEPKAGAPLKTTLDPKTQRAAETALARFDRNSSLVAIKVSDGSVVAAANNKVNYNMAFTAQVPPGSTFKAVTALGLIDTGKVTADTGVPCPQTLVVPGRPPIKNAHDFSIPGNPPFKEDFARSCNTAFSALAPQLGSDGLAKAGATVGLGQPWDLGLDANSGKVSQGGDAAEQASAAFGQGTTVVSPVAMAGVAAAIARGQWKQPKLVLDPAPAKPAPDGPVIAGPTADQLRTMMRMVVSSSSGTANTLSAWTGLHGKTGTAEYVTGDPSKTHAWFIGFTGDIAFAVFVEQGGSPSETALPITDTFLKGL